MESDYRQLVRERILTSDTFIRAVFSGEQKGASVQWVKVVVRPVELKGQVHWQFSYFDEKKDITKNYLEEAAAKVDELLALPFRNIFIESSAGNVQVNFTKKGKALVSRSKPSETATDMSHDRQKNRLLTDENAALFLKAVGIMTQDGHIKADMQRKYRQINEFLRLVDETASLSAESGQPFHVVDFGCGNAYLTFAIYFYLHEILKLEARVTGVDVNADLIERHKQKVNSLGWEHLAFQTGYIADYKTKTSPDMVIALHACDTATDDAIAQGIRWNSNFIICAPCCQHELQEQMARIELPDSLASVFQDGIFFERMGDILTDTFRATILRIMGYRTDVTQFVPIEHTAKNLMIRAAKTSQAGNERWVEQYRKLKLFWGVTPYLERLLGEEYTKKL
ncbi:MAG TPA: SAM-dependent methyltransferase [Anaerolineales bacterium]|nr:SAM-dependent methyltransferase [Anaerolineales bacterium]